MDIITEKLTTLLEEMSQNEFIEMVGDRIHKETGVNLDSDEVSELVGDKMTPLLMRIGQWIVEQNQK
jgi:hypothetical protein